MNLKPIAIVSALIFAVVFVAESFVPNSEPVYGGWHVKTPKGYSYIDDFHKKGIGTNPSFRTENQYIDTSFYDNILDEIDNYKTGKPASPKIRYTSQPITACSPTTTDSNTCVTPIISRVAHSSCMSTKKIVYNSCAMPTYQSCSTETVCRQTCNRQTCNRQTCNRQTCNRQTYNTPKYTHIGTCGRTWRHWNYQRFQPVRNIIRWFHNNQPVRKAFCR